eukprot:scpid98528/ scgid35447/ 
MASTFQMRACIAFVIAFVLLPVGAQDTAPKLLQANTTLRLSRLPGESVRLSVSLLNSPSPPAKVSWTHWDKPINISDARLELSSDGLVLSVNDLTYVDEGWYKVTLTNTQGADSVKIYLKIIVAFRPTLLHGGGTVTYPVHTNPRSIMADVCSLDTAAPLLSSRDYLVWSWVGVGNVGVPLNVRKGRTLPLRFPYSLRSESTRSGAYNFTCKWVYTIAPWRVYGNIAARETVQVRFVDAPYVASFVKTQTRSSLNFTCVAHRHSSNVTIHIRRPDGTIRSFPGSLIATDYYGGGYKHGYYSCSVESDAVCNPPGDPSVLRPCQWNSRYEKHIKVPSYSRPFLRVLSALNITNQVGENATFSFTWNYPPYPAPSIKWMHNGNPINTSADRVRLLNSGKLLKLINLMPSDMGLYTVFVNNSEGSKSVSFTLNIPGPPVVDTFSDLNTTGLLGENAT